MLIIPSNKLHFWWEPLTLAQPLLDSESQTRRQWQSSLPKHQACTVQWQLSLIKQQASTVQWQSSLPKQQASHCTVQRQS